MSDGRVVLFDLGGVLLPFDRERRVAAVVEGTGARPAAVRALFAGDMALRVDLGQANERDLAEALGGLAGRIVDTEEAIALSLSVFGAPNAALWDLALRLGCRVRVGAFTDNPPWVRRAFPKGARLDPVFFSSVLGATKPSAEAFAAVEAGLAIAPGQIVFIDDTAANVDAARVRGWDSILFRSNEALEADLAQRGLK